MGTSLGKRNLEDLTSSVIMMRQGKGLHFVRARDSLAPISGAAQHRPAGVRGLESNGKAPGGITGSLVVAVAGFEPAAKGL